MANPFVSALVVLPAWSSCATTRVAISLALRGCSAAADISTMPFALSTIGPNVSIARMYPVTLNSPSPASATPYPASARSPWKIVNDARMVAAMARTAQTDDSRPNPRPDSRNVAGPVFVEYAISVTGRRFGFVNWSVSHLMTSASSRPVKVASENRQSGAPVVGLVRYTALTATNPTTAAPEEIHNPVLMGRIGSPISSPLARTNRVPRIEANTPIPWTSRGKRISFSANAEAWLP